MSEETNAPLIVGFVSDLLFTSKIENVARHLGYRIRWVENAAVIGPMDPDAPQESPGESLHGREGQLFEKITNWRPALLIFDLTSRAIPWRQWIPALKSSPATRRLPTLCFGPHEDVKRMQLAQSLGADAVVARSRFTADMPDLIAKYARAVDHQTLQETCQEPLSELAIKGIELFNEGNYYDAHEELEDAWNEDQGPGRDLYRGILQVGVAYYQIERGNYRGAAKMLLRVRQWLDPLPDTCRGVNLARLKDDVRAVHEALTTLGPEGIDDVDRNLFRPVQYTI